MSCDQLRILTWHVHGSYLYYLAHTGCEIIVPVEPGRRSGYTGLPAGRAWPQNLREVPSTEVRRLSFDCILFQHKQHYLTDQYHLLSADQRRLPRIFLEHDPPREHPTDTRHVVDDPDVLLVHVSHFNDLMWDSGRTPTRVIEHGVTVPAVSYRGELPRGVIAVNGMPHRGRRVGRDLVDRLRRIVPLDLVGMESEAVGGLGEVPPPALPAFLARYRFFFNPTRYTSLNLAVCEAMAIGMPVVALATTEMVTVIEHGVSGFVSTNVDELVRAMELLIRWPDEARRIGAVALARARARFSIERFAREWVETFASVTGAAVRKSA
ncbi:MAG: glycosyltransferase [Vicinamibacteraceae bacterium]